MKIIKTSKAIKAQMMPLDAEDEIHYTGQKSIGEIDIEGVKIGGDQWSFLIDGDEMRLDSPLEDVIIKARRWDQDFPDGRSSIMELEKDPSYSQEELSNIFAEELAEVEENKRIYNYERKHQMGIYEDIEYPDYGTDIQYPEY